WCFDNNGDEQHAGVLVSRLYDSLSRTKKEICLVGADVSFFRIQYSYSFDDKGNETRTTDWYDHSVTMNFGTDGNLKTLSSRGHSDAEDHSWIEQLHQGPARVMECRHRFEAGTEQIELLTTNDYRDKGLLFRRSAWIKDKFFSSLPADGKVTDPS